MSVAAVILGRAGSKGVPGKNLRAIAGRACGAWTIDDALASSWVSRVIVSSDAPELLTLARSMGVEAVERPAELAGDRATVDAAARHAVGASGADVDPRWAIVVLYANVPVRPDGLIDDAIERLWASGADSVQSYQRVGKFHPWWTARVDASGAVRPWEGQVLNHNVFRRQDLPPAYVPDGGVIACTRAALDLGVDAPPGPHCFFGNDRRGVVTAEGTVIDIDTEADVVRAEMALRERSERARRAG